MQSLISNELMQVIDVIVIWVKWALIYGIITLGIGLIGLYSYYKIFGTINIKRFKKYFEV